MNKPPLILKFNQWEIDFSTVEHSELLEKLFKERPVPYFPTLVYFELFKLAYEGILTKEEDPFSFVVTYKDMEETFKRKHSTLSNALSKLEEAKFIIKDRVIIPNDQPNAKLNWRHAIKITMKIPSAIKKSLQTKAEKAQFRLESVSLDIPKN
jgi:predicted transcriptional regulator